MSQSSQSELGPPSSQKPSEPHVPPKHSLLHTQPGGVSGGSEGGGGGGDGEGGGGDGGRGGSGGGAGGSMGGDKGGGTMPQRVPQSSQSVPRSHSSQSELGPPSSQKPSEPQVGCLGQSFSQRHQPGEYGGCGGSGGAGGSMRRSAKNI